MALAHHTTPHQKRGKPLKVLETISQHVHNGRTYKLLKVETHDGLPYLCLRLYNSSNRFIKQFLFEEAVAFWLQEALPRL
jgi:hypothetical protein